MDIFLHYILPPLVGAVIGYVTNWIAVKMLFRPLYPKHIGKVRLPFTPGIIPRRKDALAKAIGRAVGDELLTKEDIAAAFAEEERKKEITKVFSDAVLVAIEKNIKELAENFLSEEDFNKKADGLALAVSDRIAAALPDMCIGERIAKVAGDAVLEKIKGTPIGIFVSESTVRTVAGGMSGKIDDYVEQHGKEKILPVVRKEISDLSAEPVKELLQRAEIDRKGVESVVRILYDRLLLPAVEEAAAFLDISSEVEKKINAMDVRALEALCLSVMKKELNAITWLGALIGLLLGIVNIFL